MRRQVTIPKFASETVLPKKRAKGIHVGAPACFALEQACQHLYRAFCLGDGGGWCGGIYVVGSVLERPDWRDVDVRLILDDAEFERLFPDAGEHWEFDPRWLVMTVAISDWLEKQTGLPVDFQFQPQTKANKLYGGKRRNACGMIFARARKVKCDEDDA